MVYVISKSGKPLMPCENVIARLLLKSGRAKVKSKILEVELLGMLFLMMKVIYCTCQKLS